MENNLIECVIDSHLFGGYTQTVPLNGIQSIEEIIGIVVSTLYSILGSYNLKGLLNHLDDLTFHVEKVTIEDIKQGRISRIKIIEDDYSSSSE